MCAVRGVTLGMVAAAGALAVAGAFVSDAGRDDWSATRVDAQEPAPAVSEPAATPTPTPTPTASTLPPRPASAGLRLVEHRTITASAETGPLSPKSIVASGTGVVYAQNMIYSHSLTAWDSDGEFLATIPDAVDLAAFGIDGHPAGTVQGGPVELAFAPGGAKAYTSNYSMYGPGFDRPGDDECSPSSGFDTSFVYRIDVATHEIDQVIPVGSVPKYVAVTPDGRYVLVTNWCTYDLSVIDAAEGREVQRLPMGRYPRGIAVSPDSRTAYVAIMGGTEVVTVDLTSFALGRFTGIGGGPRHLVISPDGATLYVTLNRDGRIAEVDAGTGSVLATVATGSAPRSMDIATDGQSLYVVNYGSSTVSKVTTSDMVEVQEVATGDRPIGITYDPVTGRVWVACYSGVIEIFDDA
jgi:YVTN family beta-propeller protein